MADFRKLVQNNRLKPKPVAIPQFDPLRELDAPPQMPKQQKTRKLATQPASATKREKHLAPAPTAATDDVDSYKSKYLQKEEEKISKTFRMYKWRFEQLEHEMRETGLKEWQIIDVGLEMYFRDRLNEK
jgi:hypothetical protein